MTLRPGPEGALAPWGDAAQRGARSCTAQQRQCRPSPGSLRRPTASGGPAALKASNRGFTLLELLVVVAIIALGTAGVSLALRDSAQAGLEREADRLAALFESARARSRASGAAVHWQVTAEGFVFEGLPPGTLPQHWLAEGTQVQGAARVVLGPEPLIGAQAVLLVRTGAAGPAWRVATDGIRPFAAQAQEQP